MKDKIIAGFEIIVGGGLAAYAAYLFYINAIVVPQGLIGSNMVILGIVLLLGILIFGMGVYPIYIKRSRLIYFIFGLVVILFGAYFLADNASSYIFTADIVKIIGALITVLGPIGLLVPDKSKKKAEEAKIEIIEV